LNQTILTAIQGKQTLSFWYSNELRVVEPHCYGVDGKGHDALRAFQRGGKGWRLFHINEMSRLTLGGQNFQPQLDYKRNDQAMDRIYAQV
jgi:predicted DNA-binding transcriptional regulator YafY